MTRRRTTEGDLKALAAYERKQARSHSSWTLTVHDSDGVTEELTITVRWGTGSVRTGDTIQVAIIAPDGTDTRKAGQISVQRVLREGRGERLIEAIAKVRVESLFGDVVGTGRSRREAAEDYASKVAHQVVTARRFARRKAAAS